MQKLSEQIPGRGGARLRDEPPDCAAVVCAVGKYMVQHLFPRHGAFIAIGEGEADGLRQIAH